MFRLSAAAICLALCASALQAQPVKLIFDTDIGNDVDDVLALTLIHNLQTRGHVELLAVTITKPDDQAAPFVEAINTFHGRPQIPVGVTHTHDLTGPSKFLKLALQRDGDTLRYPHKLTDSSQAPEAVALLRKTLAAQPDASVVIAQVGFSTNRAALLDSKADASSPLDGAALVKAKVRELAVMAGAFQTINHNNRYLEYNVKMNVPACQKLAQRWPSPIVWSGYEIGIAIPFPAATIDHGFGWTPHHYAVDAYQLYNPTPHERPTWDLTAALYLIFPDRGYFDLSPPCTVTVEPDGFTRVKPDRKGRDRYLILSDVQAARVREMFSDVCSEAGRTSGQ